MSCDSEIEVVVSSVNGVLGQTQTLTVRDNSVDSCQFWRRGSDATDIFKLERPDP